MRSGTNFERRIVPTKALVRYVQTTSGSTSIVKRKTYKTDWPLLRWVAEHSPKGYARHILRRNEELLKAMKDGNWGHSSNWGCPHCHSCVTCLWTKGMHALNRKHISLYGICACVYVLFGGITLQENRIVQYDANCEYLREPVFSGCKRIAEARRFLKAHIAWAKKPYWGRKVDK